MRLREIGLTLLSTAMLVATAMAAHGQSATTEVFTGTATVKATSGATASAPVIITVQRTTPQDELDQLTAVFKKGGAAALRKALAALPRTGSVQLGNGQAVPTRITVERTTPRGRALRIITDTPVMFVGAGLPGAKAREGYDFAVVGLDLDATGHGSGTIAPAAKIKADAQGSFAVEDYSTEVVKIRVALRGK